MIKNHLEEFKDRLENLSARATAADFVTRRNVQMHYAAFQFCLQSQLQ